MTKHHDDPEPPSSKIQRDETVRVFGPERWLMVGSNAFPLTLVARRYRRDDRGQELLVDSYEYRRVEP